MAKLYIVSTPIGNLEDITIRALRVMFSVPVLVSEDTRVTGKLLASFRNNSLLRDWGVDVNYKPILVSCNDSNEASKVNQIIAYLQKGLDVALVSDAGTPVISDPGYKIIRHVIASGFRVVPVPGVSAVMSAMSVSQMPPSSMFYCGFLPNKQRARSKYLHELSNIVRVSSKKCTVVAFESPYRILSLLDDMSNIYGESFELFIAREITKMYEQLETKSVGDWKKYFDKYPPKGEFTLCFVPPMTQPVESEE